MMNKINGMNYELTIIISISPIQDSTWEINTHIKFQFNTLLNNRKVIRFKTIKTYQIYHQNQLPNLKFKHCNNQIEIKKKKKTDAKLTLQVENKHKPTITHKPLTPQFGIYKKKKER